jgi:hypothetical protein
MISQDQPEEVKTMPRGADGKAGESMSSMVNVEKPCDQPDKLFH